MRLCDHYTPARRGDPPKTCAAGPLRDTAHPDQLRCLRCGWWTPHGALPSHERVALLAAEAASILAKFADDYRWAHSAAFDPTRRPAGGGGRNGHGDPTGGAVANQGRLAVRDYTAIAARLLERIMRDLRNADEALGDALLAAEPPGPKQHTKAAYHDTGGLRFPDPNVYDAQARRHARGEGIPT